MVTEHWTATAKRVGTQIEWRLLGEDDKGVLYVPRAHPYRGGYIPIWDTPFTWWKPRHWSYYLRSRLQREIAFLEQQ